MIWLICCHALAAVAGNPAESEPSQSWTVEIPADARSPASVGQRLTGVELAALAAAQPVTPFAELSVGVRLEDGTVWAGSPKDLMYLAPGADRWRWNLDYPARSHGAPPRRLRAGPRMRRQ